MNDITFTPGPTPNSVRSADGNVLAAPEGWILLPPGDAALTRRVKAAGDHCYDSMVIPRVKRKRREVRRMLAQRSKELLGRYRRGETVEECPLKKALN
jgi:hypothetical protein